MIGVPRENMLERRGFHVTGCNLLSRLGLAKEDDASGPACHAMVRLLRNTKPVFVQGVYFTFYQGKSPVNHHLGNIAHFFQTTKQAKQRKQVR